MKQTKVTVSNDVPIVESIRKALAGIGRTVEDSPYLTLITEPIEDTTDYISRVIPHYFLDATEESMESLMNTIDSLKKSLMELACINREDLKEEQLFAKESIYPAHVDDDVGVVQLYRVSVCSHDGVEMASKCFYLKHGDDGGYESMLFMRYH